MRKQENDQKGRDLDQMLGQASSSWVAYRNSSDQESKWTILNKILFVLGGETPNVIFATHADGNGEGTGKIAAFTNTCVLYGEGDMDSLSFKLVPRCNLEAMEIHTASPVTSWSDKENQTRITLNYNHGIQISLPLGEDATNWALTQLDSLVPHFLNELVSTAS